MPDGKPGSSLRQFYVAVGTEEAKLATLLDLLRAFESATPLSLVVCCGARDSLDAVCSTTLAMPCCRVWCLHADLSETEMELTVKQFAASSSSGTRPSSNVAADGDGVARGVPLQQQQMAGMHPTAAAEQSMAVAAQPLIEVLATTDACLKALPKELLPLAPTLLVNYDLPSRKEVYLRRITAVVGSRSRPSGGLRLAINFVVAGQVEKFRQLEGFADRAIEEMPVHVSDILHAPSLA